jgi:DNA-binding transcriptional ArsR family regulator
MRRSVAYPPSGLLRNTSPRSATSSSRSRWASSDPTRLTLAAALREGGELCVCDLSWISGRKQALVSHHLRTLRSEGLARSRRDGKLVMYSLTDEGRSLLSAVLGEPTEAKT